MQVTYSRDCPSGGIGGSYPTIPSYKVIRLQSYVLIFSHEKRSFTARLLREELTQDCLVLSDSSGDVERQLSIMANVNDDSTSEDGFARVEGLLEG